MIPLRAVKHVALEVLDAWYVDLVRFHKTTSTADEDFALLDEFIASLPALEATSPRLRLFDPSCIDPLNVQLDVLIDAEFLRRTADVGENLGLFWEDFREVWVRREG